MDPSYNNPFGSFGANSGQPTSSQPGASMQPVQPAPILSPVGGDIVLPSQPKKKKTWLIIGIILIIVAIVAGIVAGVMLLNGNKKDTNLSREKCRDLVMYGNENPSPDTVEDNGFFERFYYDSNVDEWNAFYSKISHCLNIVSNESSSEPASELNERLRIDYIKRQREILKVLDYDKGIGNRVMYLSGIFLNNKSYDAQTILEKELNGFDESIGGTDVGLYKKDMKELLARAEENLRYYEMFGCEGDSLEEFSCDNADFNINVKELYGIEDISFAEYMSAERYLDEDISMMVSYTQNGLLSVFGDKESL